jgi:hypothetical protein
MRCFAIDLFLVTIMCVGLAGCGIGGGGKKTSVTITNKVESVQAGQTVDFDVDVEHDQGAGFTVTLTGAGSLVQNGGVATYIAPPTVPDPNLVTITITAANGSGAKDEMTFTIKPAPGPVVHVSPATFEVTGGGAPFTLTITVTDDDPADVLTAGVNGGVGTFSPFIGAVGGGTYTVQFIPLSSVAETSTQELHVMSSLAHSTPGVAFVTVKAGTFVPPPGCTDQGHEGALTSQHAFQRWMFLLRGEGGGQPMAMAGFFTPDGIGGITEGVLDINVSGSAPIVGDPIIPQQSTYSVGADGRGCLSLGTAHGARLFHIAMDGMSNPAGPVSGQIMEFDDASGSGERAVGRLQLMAIGGTHYEDSLMGPASFNLGLEGWDIAGGHAAAAGNLSFDGQGHITGGRRGAPWQELGLREGWVPGRVQFACDRTTSSPRAMI